MSAALNLSFYQQPGYGNTGSIGTTAASLSLVPGTGAIGATINNPYVLSPNATSVNFGMGSQPQYLSYNGGVYQYAGAQDQTLNYKSTSITGQTLSLTYTGNSGTGQNVTGYDSYREQVGTEQYQVGTEKYITGYQQVQTGTEKVQVGTEKYQTGTEQVLVGYEQVQTGTEKYKSGTEQVLTGYKDVQTGTEQYITGYKDVVTGYKDVQTGTEQYIKGYEQVITGYKDVQTGTEQYITGYKQVQTGTEKVQVGTEQYITGYKQVQTGTEKVQVGTEQYITGYKQVQTGTEKVQVGTEQYIKGYEQVQTGTKQVQVGTEQYITGTQKVQVGTEKIQTGTQIVGYNTRTETGTINVSRELDGRANGGAVGDILDSGSALLLDANKANSFFTTNSGQYRVSGLHAENNTSVGEKVDIFQKIAADDMYVAGDPVVGGKGNNYKPEEVIPNTGYITMFEDGLNNGRKFTINANVQTINPQGDRAFTEYGWVIQDDSGKKINATLSGGRLFIDGQQLLPGQEKIIGDPKDPVAKFYYASVPGGENGKLEQRVVFEAYEKVTPETRAQLIAAGANPAEVDSLRSTFKATFGFRIPDGSGSYRSSAGVPGGLSTTTNGVKTYYDAHFYEPPSFQLNTTKEYKDPIYGPVYTEKPIYEDRPVYGTRPVYKEEPVYEKRPVYGERPVYEDRPVYGQQPVYGTRPVYEDRPVYGKEPVYGTRPVYEDRPVYGKEPIYGERPVYGKEPIYGQKPIYGERPVYGKEPIYGKEPVYATRPVYGKEPVYETRDVYSERPVYTQKPIYETRPVYGERPVYEDRPVYGKEPIYGERPVYKDRPVYQDVQKPVYDKTYSVTIGYDNKPAYPPAGSNDNGYVPAPGYTAPVNPPAGSNDQGAKPPVVAYPPASGTAYNVPQGNVYGPGVAQPIQQPGIQQPIFGQQPVIQPPAMQFQQMMPQLMFQMLNMLQMLMQLFFRR